MTRSLPVVGDRDALARTRLSWHSVAEHVLAPARYRAEQRIGLTVTPGGFGTPVFGAGECARVEGRELVVTEGSSVTTVELTTVAAAAAAVGIEPGNPPVYAPTTPLSPDAPLYVDPHAAPLLAAWFDLASAALTGLGEPVTLWPEHFDVATEPGDERRGERGTFGASPGDAEHPTPYLYVTHWADVPDDAFWNDDAFGGASVDYSEIALADDPDRAARAFFARGRATLLSQE